MVNMLNIKTFIGIATGSLRGLHKRLAVFIVLGMVAGTTVVLAINSHISDVHNMEKDHRAPIDYGFGPGKGKGMGAPNLILGQTPAIPQSKLPQTRAMPQTGHAVPQAIPSGGGSGGYFADPVTWPLIPLHMALLPDGRVMSYGTDQNGNQGGQIIYDVWTPSLGTGSSSHNVLPNATNTDIFCSAGSLLGSEFRNGAQLLITGGDVTINGVRNFGGSFVNFFSPATNTLSPAPAGMNYARWYPTITTLPNGDKFLMGGYDQTQTPTLTPEIYHLSTSSWTTLPGISIGGTVNNSNNTWEWFYPRGFIGADGLVYLIQNSGQIFRLTIDGSGTMTDTGVQAFAGWAWYPTLMVEPYKVLTIRQSFNSPSGDFVQLVDLSQLDTSQNPPVVKPQVSMLAQLGPDPNSPGNGLDRIWSTATLLPDGRVLVTGGSSVANQLVNAAGQSVVYYQAQIYDPSTNSWSFGASAQKPRLYHSGALLLPDGSVLTGGGGAPGPTNELNAEIYYPSYLYLKDGSGNPAPRPNIVSAPSTLSLGQTFTVTMGSGTVNAVGSISLIKLGYNTHSFDPEQRRIPLSFTQSGGTVTATLGNDGLALPAGFYMLFVFNTAGVPAVASIVEIVHPLPDLIPTSLSYSAATQTFTSVISNQGTAATPNGWLGVIYSVDGQYCTWGGLTKSLAAGASVTIGTGGGPCVIPAGTHTISVLADDQNLITESNKNNNTLSQTITVASTPLPDLVPTSLSYSAATQTFTSVISNQGTAATPNGWLGVIYSVDGQYCTWGGLTKSLAAGASVTIGTGGGPCVIPAGTHTISVLADDQGLVAESNKSNNTLSQTITVAATPLPDLIPASLTYDPATQTFTSVISNQGTAATPNGWLGVIYSVDGQYCTWGGVTKSLAAGASVTIGTGGGPCVIPAGTHTITVLADDQGLVAESNKSNNTLSRTITVSP